MALIYCLLDSSRWGSPAHEFQAGSSFGLILTFADSRPAANSM